MGEYKGHRRTDTVATLVEDASLSSDVADPSQEHALEKQFAELRQRVIRTPLPKLQIAVLCLLKLGEPICFFVIFPFIPQMVRDLGVAQTDEQAGYYAGLVESVFALTQTFTVLKWGRLSDRIGRKPVLMLGLAGLAVSMLSFGLATSFTGILLARCIAGAFSGNSSVIQSVLGEITDSTNQASAFALFPLMSGIGGSIGPFIGGYLCEPAKQFPSYFDTPFHRKYPYFLACTLTSFIPLLGTILCWFSLQETVPQRRPKTEEYTMVATSPTSVDKEDLEAQNESEASDGPKPLLELLTPSFCWVLLSHGLIVMTSTGCLALYPLVGFTPVQSGGLGLSTHIIGGILAFRGCITIIVQLAVFAQIQHRYGSVGALRRLTWCFPMVFVLYPLLTPLAQAGHGKLTIAGTCLTTFFWACGNMSWSTSSIIMISHAPSKQDLGSLSGLMETVASAVRAFAPTFSSYIFALSVDQHWLNGRFWWMAMLCFALSECLVTWKLSEGNASWRQQQPSALKDDDVLEREEPSTPSRHSMDTLVGSPVSKIGSKQ